MSHRDQLQAQDNPCTCAVWTSAVVAATCPVSNASALSSPRRFRPRLEPNDWGCTRTQAHTQSPHVRAELSFFSSPFPHVPSGVLVGVECGVGSRRLGGVGGPRPRRSGNQRARKTVSPTKKRGTDVVNVRCDMHVSTPSSTILPPLFFPLLHLQFSARRARLSCVASSRGPAETVRAASERRPEERRGNDHDQPTDRRTPNNNSHDDHDRDEDRWTEKGGERTVHHREFAWLVALSSSRVAGRRSPSPAVGIVHQ